jgi:hypothetical protein
VLPKFIAKHIALAKDGHNFVVLFDLQRALDNEPEGIHGFPRVVE